MKECIADAGPVYPTGWLNAQQAKGKCWLQVRPPEPVPPLLPPLKEPPQLALLAPQVLAPQVLPVQVPLASVLPQVLPLARPSPVRPPVWPPVRPPEPVPPLLPPLKEPPQLALLDGQRWARLMHHRKSRYRSRCQQRSRHRQRLCAGAFAPPLPGFHWLLEPVSLLAWTPCSRLGIFFSYSHAF